MIQDVNSFIKYFDSVRRRTIKFIQAIPDHQIDWAPRKDEFTCGDIVRHLAATELMFVKAVVVEDWEYLGHDRSLASSLAETIEHLERCHIEATAFLHRLSNSDLSQPRPTLNGPPVKGWRLLMAMVEHEVHHRSQLAVYLTLMGVKPPHIYGLGVEDVVVLSAKPDKV